MGLITPPELAGSGAASSFTETTARPAELEAGFLRQCWALLQYLAETEVHTYAFSVAANAILSLFPFIVLMLTVSRRVFHSQAMEGVVGDMVRYFLPTGQEFVVKNMTLLANAHSKAQLLSVVMLLVTSTGVFLPLEVALNQVWGVAKNRNYLHNQLVSLGLAAAVALLTLCSIAATAGQQRILSFVFFGHTQNVVFEFLAGSLMRIFAVTTSILLFFLLYWILPNRKLPIRAVLPTAIVTGLIWELAKVAYIASLPWLDFKSVYGPFATSVGLMVWAFLTGMMLLAGAHFSASRHSLRLARQAEIEEAVTA